mmetsp:Transcript_57783/g.187763  ORF Transcript_57783/g.187763 Transcript_57783/m.187763 type:complete len:205 (-) Transcript_57783:378-992(-)
MQRDESCAHGPRPQELREGQHGRLLEVRGHGEVQLRGVHRVPEGVRRGGRLPADAAEGARRQLHRRAQQLRVHLPALFLLLHKPLRRLVHGDRESGRGLDGHSGAAAGGRAQHLGRQARGGRGRQPALGAGAETREGRGPVGRPRAHPWTSFCSMAAFRLPEGVPVPTGDRFQCGLEPTSFKRHPVDIRDSGRRRRCRAGLGGA